MRSLGWLQGVNGLCDCKSASHRLAYGRQVFAALRPSGSGIHIYHYAPYEPAALKWLMGRYATPENEIDKLLRAGLFVAPTN
jgi:hypothetical protein